MDTKDSINTIKSLQSGTIPAGVILSVVIAAALWFIVKIVLGIYVGWIFTISIFCICMVLVIILDAYVRKQDKELIKKIEMESRIAEENRIRRESEIKEKYGESGLDIKNPSFDADDSYFVRVFFQKEIVLLNEKAFSFSDIISCYIVEQTGEGVEMKTIQTPTTNNAGIAGRAIAGGLIAGPAGAIIGGLTANNSVKNDIRFVPTTVVNYIVNIFTKNADFPCVKIETEESLALANEIKGAVDGIIALNASKQV